jgi:cytochrome P450/acyl-CoA synthetase (AMP-forming)/AMP-acid ligase II
MAILVSPAAAVRPAEQAIADEERALTWSELDARVNRWIHALRDLGLSTGDSLAIVAGNRVDTMEALLACLHSGLTAVPVNWHLTAGEIAYQLDDSGAVAVVADPVRACVVAQAVKESRSAPVALVLGGRDEPGCRAVEPLLAASSLAEPREQCCGSIMLYTSGTTGQPKGVVNGLFTTGAPFRRVKRLLDYAGRALGVPGSGTALLAGPWYHSAQLFFSLLPLLRGARLVMRPRFDPADALAVIDRERVNVCHLVPTHFVRLLRLPDEVRAGFDGSSLNRVWHGGAPCAPEVKRKMLDWWGRCLVEYYAATEGGVATLIDAEEWLARPGSVGRPVPPTEVLVVDEDGTPLPPGVAGRVFLRRAPDRDFHYHNAPEKTAAAHLAPGVFTYGELGHLDEDGYLYLTGRHQDMILSGGVNIYPAEVEAVLLDHPGVRDAAVVGVPDVEYGERVLAVVEVDADRLAPAAVPDELNRYCRSRLAGFKVPRAYRVLPELPREPTGKLRKQLLREQLLRERFADAAMAAAVDVTDRADIAHPATYGAAVPYLTFARLRRQRPVVWTAEPDLVRHSSAGSMVQRGSGFWAVLGHDAIVEASRRTEDFSSGEKGAFMVDPRTRADLERARELLINMDAPRHSLIRRLATSVFTPRAVRALAAGVEAHAERLVAAAVAKGECDAVADLAAELPLVVLADLLAMPQADRHLLFRWSNQLVGFDDPEYGGGDVEAYRRTFAEAFQYALAVAAERRANPGEDLVSLLATTEVDGRRLTDREFCHFWLLLVVAGNETTRHLLSGTILALGEHPDQRRRLAGGPDLIPTAVEELLRWVTPIMQFRRTAVRDTELAGQPIAAGDKVLLYYAAANRDPAVFPAPESLDLGRDPNPHLAFGIGPHFCLGANLARLEARAVLAALRPHLSMLELTGPPVRLESNFVNGLKALPISLGPAG